MLSAMCRQNISAANSVYPVQASLLLHGHKAFANFQDSGANLGNKRKEDELFNTPDILSYC